jgi:hypothetical protein
LDNVNISCRPILAQKDRDLAVPLERIPYVGSVGPEVLNRGAYEDFFNAWHLNRRIDFTSGLSWFQGDPLSDIPHDVHVLLAGEAPRPPTIECLDRLLQMLSIVAYASTQRNTSGRIGLAERVVALSGHIQPGGGGDAAALEFELQAMLENAPMALAYVSTGGIFDYFEHCLCCKLLIIVIGLGGRGVFRIADCNVVKHIVDVRLLSSHGDRSRPDAPLTAIPVGTRVTPRPPDRSERALLTHSAPTSGAGR